MSFALIGAVGHVDGVGERRAEGHEALAVLAVLGEVVEPCLRLLNLGFGRLIDGAVEGGVDQVLANDDELAAHGQVVDGPAIVMRIDDGGGTGGQATQVLGDREMRVDRLGVLEERLQGDRRGLLARLDELCGNLIDLRMQGVVEMDGLQEARDPIQSLVVDQDGAQQGLFGLDIVGYLAELDRLVGGGGRA